MRFKPPFQSITQKVLLALAVSIILVMSVAGVAYYNVEKNKAVSHLQQKAAQISERLSNSLVYPLWNVSTTEIAETIDLETADEDIQAIILYDEFDYFLIGRIKDDKGRTIPYSPPQKGPIQIKEALFSVDKKILKGSEYLGEARLYFTDRNVNRYLQNLVWQTILLTALVSIFSVLIIYYTLHRIVLTPIMTLQKMTDRLRASLGGGVPGNRITTNRDADEIGLLGYNFEAMADELSQSQDRLRHTAEHLQALQDETPDAVVSLNAVGRIIDVNKTFVEMFGHTQEDILQRPSFELVSQNLSKEAIFGFLEQALTGEHVAFEWQALRKDNTSFPAYARLRAMHFGDERRLLAVVTDITDRKKQDEALRLSEEKYRHLVDNVSREYFFYTHGTDGVMTYVSPSVHDMMGYTQEEFLTHYTAFLTDNPINQEVIEKTNLCLQGLKQPPYQLETYHKSGHRIWLEVSEVSVCDGDGKVIAVEGLAHNITARKLAEEALRVKTEELEGFFSSAVDLLCIVDTDGHFLRLNLEWQRVLGYDLAEMVGHRILDFIHPDDVEPTMDAMATLRSQIEVTNFTNRYRCKDGSYRWLEWHAVPAGPMIYAAARDITERILTEDALRTSEARLRAISDNLPGGMIYQIIISPHGERRFTYVSNSVERMHEVTVDDVLKDASILYNQIAEEDRPGLILEEEKCIEEMKTFRMEARSVLPSGLVRWMKITSQPRTLPSGEILFDGLEIDINELKLTEQALRESEERFSKAFQANPAPMAITEIASGLFLDANDKWLNLFGYTREELIGRTSLELNMHVDPALRQAMITQLRQEGSFKEVDMLIQTKAGQYVNALWSAELITLGGRAVMLTLLIDVTERKKAELRILESMGLLQATLESAADGILVTDLNACVINYNRRFVELSQIPETMLASGDDRTVLKRVLAQLKEPGTFLKGVRDLYAHPDIEQHDVLRFLDGRFFESYSIPTYRGDEIIGRVWSFRDVTDAKHAEEALRESEDRFAKAFHANPAPMVITDLDTGRFLDANDRWFKLIGYTRAEMIGFTSLDLNIYADLGTRDATVAILQKQDFFRETDLRLRTKSGQIVDVLWSAEIINLTGQKAMLSLLIDVTERKLAEEALQNSRNALSTLLDNTYDAIFLHDLEGRVTGVNQRMLDLYQVTREQIPHLTIYDYSTPDNPLENLPALWENVLAGEKERFEWIARRPNDGSTFPVEVFLTKIQLGFEEKILANVRDITERKRAEEALRESEERYRSIVENIAEGIFQTSLEGKFLSVNPALVRMFGYSSPEEMIENIKDIGHQVYANPADRQQIMEALRQYGHVSGFECENIRRDGTRFWVAISAHFVRDAQREVLYIEGTTMDITERKQAENALRQSEAKYRRLHESMTDAFARTDMQGRLLEANKAFQDMLGYTHEELSQISYKDLTPSIWHTGETAIIENQVLPRGYSDIYEKEYIRKDGTIFPVELITYLARDESGQPTGLWAIVRDITERKKAEEALRESEALFRSQFEYGNIGIAITSREKGWLRVNHYICDLLGYSEEELKCKTWTEMTHPEDLQADVAQFNRLLAGEIDAYEMDKRFVRKDREIIVAHLSVSCFRNADRSVRFVIASLLDITETTKAVEKLRTSEATLRALMNATADALFVMDKKGNLLALNDTLARRFGQSVDEMLGTSINDYMPANLARQRLAYLAQAVVSGQPVHFVDERQEMWFENTFYPIFDTAGAVVMIAAYSRDVTETKKAEEALRLTQFSVDRASDSILWLDENANLIYANDAVCTALGYTREELLSMSIHDLDPDFPPEAWLPHVEELRRRKAITFESGHRTKDGRIFPVEVTCNYFEYNGHFYSFSFDRDISQRKQTELELKQYRDHLEEQVRERTQALSEANDALIRFRRFAEASGQGFGMATLDGTIIYANATLRDLINDDNLNASESLSFIERYPVEYRNKLQNEIIPQILEDKQWIGELALVTVSGEIIPTIENYFLIRDEAGNPSLIADVVTDIRDMKRTENELKKYQDHLEDLVKKRTRELQKLNKDLQKEIIIRTDAEKALRASEQRYRTLFDNAPIGISIMKPDLTFDYFNPRFTEMTGYSLDDLPDKNAWFEKAYPNPDYRQKVTEMWQKDLKSEAGTERKGDRILKVRTQKGQDIIIHFRTAVLENGEHLMSYEDVTELQDLNDALRAEIAERVLAEEALRESEERYRTLFNGAPVGISVTTADGTIVAANEGLANLLKASSIVETFDTNARSVYLDPLEREKLLERLSRDGYVRDYETRLQCLDGMIRDVLITLSRISYQGKDAIMAVLQDISWKKQAEEETRHLKNYLANIIDSMPSMLVGVDIEGQVTQWNTAAQETTGIDANLARGQHLEQVLPLLSHHIDLIREAIYANRAQIFPRLQNVIKGENRFMDVTVYPLVSNGVSGAVVRVDDVSDRIRMEEMMIQSEKMLSVGGLAAGMAHEINNPLGVIMAATQNVVRRIAPDLPANIKTAETCGLSLSAVHDYMEKRQILTFLEDIRNGVVRANQIVTNMLSFSRRPSEGGALESMADLLDQTLLLAASDYDLKKKYDFRQILIERDYHPETPKVFCQASKIQQVFLNILRNGAEAMEENRGSKHPPCFKLRLYPDQDRVRIEIQDNGPGMDEATRRRIFEPFFTTKPPGVGTGLGLSVSYFIITQNHDGTISVESAPGEGTCFIIELPVKEYPV